MSVLDFLLILSYSVIVLVVGFVIRLKNKENPFYIYFLPGLFLKIIGAISFCLIYIYYYGYGDSMVYFQDSLVLTNALINDPKNGIKLLFMGAKIFDYDTNYISAQMELFKRANDTFLVVKFAAIINLFTFSNYFATTILFSVLSFVGIWRFYLSMCKKFPMIPSRLAWSILFFPSIVFWGSGIMKDTLVIGFLGLAINGFVILIEKGKKDFFQILLVALCVAVILIVKAYVVLALVPPIILWWQFKMQGKIKNVILRFAMFPMLLLLGFIIISSSLMFLSKYSKAYSLDKLANTAATYQKNHYGDGTFTKDGQGSSYTLGDYEPTLTGALLKFPLAVNVTFFRPYLWEIRNPVMALSAIESSFVLGLTIYILFNLRYGQIITIFRKQPFLIMCFFYAIFFGYAVGFTSYNFGALVRYKIPCMPFYLITLFVMDYEVKKIKATKWQKNIKSKYDRIMQNEEYANSNL